MKRSILYLLTITSYLWQLQATAQNCPDVAVDESKFVSANLLQDLAIYAANNVCPNQTFYITEDHENILPSNANPVGINDLYVYLFANPPHVITDCSGWVSAAVKLSAPEAYAAVNQYKTSENIDQNQNWPRAHVYKKYFQSVINDTEAHWETGTDISQVQGGEVLTWCANGWCSTTENGEANANTGHIMLVLNAEQVMNFTYDNSNVTKDILGGGTVPDDATIMALSVVDESSAQHADGEGIKDLRNYNTVTFQNADKYATSPVAGGLGAGIIMVAQWTDDNVTPSVTRQANLFNYKDNQVKWHTDDNTLEIAWGRVRRFPQLSTIINEVQHTDTGNGGRTSGLIELTSTEHAELVNASPLPEDISGYQLWDGTQVRHTFEPGTVLQPDQAIIVYSGNSIPKGQSFSCALAIPASSGALNLDDTGDVLVLKAADGTTVDSLSFGPADGYSLTRFPALTGNFVSHQQFDPDVAGSPGTDVDGTAFGRCIEFSQSYIEISEGNSGLWVDTAVTSIEVFNASADSALFTTTIDVANSTATIANSTDEAGDVLATTLEQSYTVRYNQVQEVIINVNRLGDRLLETDKTVTVTLQQAAGNTTPIGPNNTLTIRLLDDEDLVTGTGIDELAALQVYPNPTTGTLNINSRQPLQLQLTDLLGRVQLQTALPGNGTIDVNGLRPGIYLLHCQAEGQSTTKKIVIQ